MLVHMLTVNLMFSPPVGMFGSCVETAEGFDIQLYSVDLVMHFKRYHVAIPGYLFKTLIADVISAQ